MMSKIITVTTRASATDQKITGCPQKVANLELNATCFDPKPTYNKIVDS